MEEHHNYILSVIILLFLMVTTPVSVKAASDQIIGDLRVDNSDINTSRDYMVWLSADYATAGYDPTYTAAWIGINLANNPGTYGQLFSQVGILVRSDGPHWFVYAETDVVCERGSYYWWNNDLQKYLGCIGDSTDYIDNYVKYYQMELLHQPGYWVAKVADDQGNLHQVARILSNNSTIYRAQVTMEQAYPDGWANYHLQGQYDMWHPIYHSAAFNGYGLWPQSSSSNSDNRNLIWPWSSIGENLCPAYYSTRPSFNGDPYEWYAGTGAYACKRVIFLPTGPQGIYDDNNFEYIDYEDTVNWTHAGPSPSWVRNWQSTSSYSNTPNRYYSMTFNGTDVSRVFAMHTSHGYVDIYIDGRFKEAMNDYASAPTRWQMVKTWSVPAGDHTIEVIGHNDTAYNDLDAFVVNVNAAPPATYDDSNTSRVGYVGTWTHSTGLPAYNGTESYSKNTEDAFKVTFNGSSITYCFSKYPNRGIAGIYIDGVNYGTIDMYKPAPTQWTYCQSPYNLPSGIHTLHVVVTGTKNQSATDCWVGVDKIIVTP
jgi:hypothetical protein